MSQNYSRSIAILQRTLTMDFRKVRSKVAKPMIFKSNENEMLWQDEIKAEKLCTFPKNLNVF